MARAAQRRAAKPAATVPRATISIAFAERLIAETAKESAKLGRNTVIAVCDESGVLKAFRRSDNSHVRSVGLAITKARSAVGFETPTHVFYEAFKNDPRSMMGVNALDDFTILGGGFPIRVGGQVIGGIGVSGAQSSQEDIDFIVAAFRRLGIDTDVSAFA